MARHTVVLDARFYGIDHTGIGRYVQNLIAHLPEKITLIVGPKDYHRPELASFPKIISHTHPYSFLSQIEIPIILFRLKPDLVHIPYSSIPVFWPGKFVVTFHDLIKHVSIGSDTTTRNPLFYWFKYFGYRIIDLVALRRATSIIVPTQYWKNIIHLKYALKNVYVTHEAVGEDFINLKPCPVPGLKKPFLVHTGNLYPHKNLAVVYQAMSKIKYRLYLICARSIFALRHQDQIQKMGLQDKVIFLGKLTDAQTKYVYSQAEALVFPSKIEGFGLNGLEAMSVGLPVISSKSSCLPEVHGDAALYFAADDPDDFIKQLNLLPKYRRQLIKLGYAQVKKFSWAKMADQTWDIYQNALL